MTSQPVPSAASPSHPPIRTSSTSPAAKAFIAPISLSATVCTSPHDAGATWTHLGLRDGQQMRTIAIDPKDANRLFIAVTGHPYGPNEERGIYRSTDGGQSFKRVLYKDENTGGSDVVLDPANPSTVYAALWEAREGPWENGAWNGTNGGIFKSTDGGDTWQPLTKGLPDGIVQANLTIAASNPNRLIAAVASKESVGLYRTDDAGASWAQITTDTRPAGRIGGGDLPVPKIDPRNPDVVYSTSTVIVEVHRWREDVDRISRRTRRR